MKQIKSMTINGNAVKKCEMGGGILMDYNTDTYPTRLAEVEWLRNDSAGRIDMPDRITAADSIEWSFSFDGEAINDYDIMGQFDSARNDWAFLCGWFRMPPSGYHAGVNIQFLGKILSLNEGRPTVYRAFVSNGRMELNGQRLDFPAVTDAFNSPNPRLLSIFFSPWQKATNMVLFGMKWRRNGSPLYDLRPCVRVEDSHPGLYDAVSRNFFPAANPANITAGRLTGTYYNAL